MAKDYQITQLNANNELDVLHPETNANNVLETTDKKIMTAQERQKLANIEAGAQVNVIEGVSVNGTPVTPSNKIVNIEMPTDVGADLSYNGTTGVLSLIDKDGNVLGSVDLPLELLIQSGYYDGTTRELVLVLANSTPQTPSEIRIPVGDLIDTYVGDGINVEVDSNNVIKLTQAFLTRITTLETFKSNVLDGTVKAKKSEQADKLANAITIETTGDVTGSGSFDGSADLSIALTLKAVGTAGTYSVVQTDSKGRVISGAQLIEVGTTGQTTPSQTLAVGGLFFKEI